MIRHLPAPRAIRREISRQRPNRASQKKVGKIGTADQKHESEGPQAGALPAVGYPLPTMKKS